MAASRAKYPNDAIATGTFAHQCALTFCGGIPSTEFRGHQALTESTILARLPTSKTRSWKYVQSVKTRGSPNRRLCKVPIHRKAKYGNGKFRLETGRWF